MIPQEFRLKKDKDFEVLFEEGNFVKGKLVNIKYLDVSSGGYENRFKKDDLKIGVVVSNKIEKSAVKRNKKKRQIREVLNDILSKNKIKKGYIFAVLAKKELLDKSYSQIHSDIHKNLIKSNILKSD